VAVGAKGTILSGHGKRWRKTSFGSKHLYAVWFGAAGDAWAAGEGGTLLHQDRAGQWQTVTISTPVDLLAGASDGQGNVLVLGRGGRTFLALDDNTTKELAPSGSQELTAVIGNRPLPSARIERRAARIVPARFPLPDSSLPYPDNVISDQRIPNPDRATPRRGFGTPMLFGALTHSGVLPARNASCRACYNSAILLGEQGEVRDIYDKRFLLVFGEYLPFGERWPELYEMLPETSRFQPGTRTLPVEHGKARIGMLICYEDLLPGHVLRVSGHNPNVYINLTNDAWFGKTAEPYHHLQLAQMRTIEHRRWLIRSTNTGVSVYIDAVGRRVKETSLDDAETLIADVPLMEGRTVYATLGDWPLVALAVMLLLTWARALRRSGGRVFPRGGGNKRPRKSNKPASKSKSTRGGKTRRKKKPDKVEILEPSKL
jgi:hypothetical protein